MSSKFKTSTIEETQLVYSILRERYPNQQIEIEFDDRSKEYTLNISKDPFKYDPEVPLDVKIKVVYGDSVTGDTPLLLKKAGSKQVYIETISSIFNESEKFEYPGFKLFDKSIRLEKEYSLSNYQIWTDIGWVDIKKVIRHRCDKKIYRVLTHTGCVDVTEDHSLINDNLEPVKPGELKTGDALLHSFPKEFPEVSKSTETYFKTNDKLEAQKVYYKFKSTGACPTIKTNKNEFIIQIDPNFNLDNEFKVTKIECLGVTNDFVYDLETSIGRFGAGVGQLQCYNTDSIFLSMKFNREDFEQNRKDAFKLGIVCGDNLTNDIFKRPPIELEFEKVYQPFILLTKKRYIGKKFEDTRDPLKLKTVTTAGIALTRRDYCLMVKRCYKEIIDTIMEGKESSVQDSLDIFKDYILRIKNYQIPFEDLIVSAMLAKNYSCALCKEKCEWNVLKCDNIVGKKTCKENNVVKRSDCCSKCGKKFRCIHTFSLAHVNLAVTLLQRNEEIQVNDRIQYLFVESLSKLQKDSKKADLAEDPKYAKDHNLKFNRVCYLEQLAKPILGFYKIVLKDDPKTLDHIITFVNDNLVSFGGKKLRPSDFKLIED